MATLSARRYRLRITAVQRRQLRYIGATLLCLLLLSVTVTRRRPGADGDPAKPRSVHEALRNNGAELNLGGSDEGPAVEHHASLPPDEDGLKPRKQRRSVAEPSDDTPAPESEVDEETLWKAKLKLAFDNADEHCVATTLDIPELVELGRQMYSSSGGENARCMGALPSVRPYLPIIATPKHPRCATPRFESDIINGLASRAAMQRGRGRAANRVPNLWPSLKAHMQSLDFVEIEHWKQTAPFMMRMCPPPKSVHHWYFDVGPITSGLDNSLDWFYRYYPNADTFRTVVVGPQREVIEPIVERLNVELSRRIAEKWDEEHYGILPAKGEGKGTKAPGAPPSIEELLAHAGPGATLPPVIVYHYGLAWNQTGYVTQLSLAPATFPPVNGEPIAPESPTGTPKAGKGGRIDIIVESPPPTEAPPPPRWSVRHETNAPDPMADLYNDRMLPTVYHEHESTLDKSQFKARVAALDDGLGAKYARVNRTMPAVDLSEIILRYAEHHDFVVLRLNAVGFEWMLIERLMTTGALRAVDEVLLVCRNTEASLAWNTPVTPQHCQELVNSLRALGLYVHEWFSW
jgi:hypothetical protein